MNIGKNARERALPWGNFVGHVAFPKRSAAMLGQFGRLIQSDEKTARDQFRRMLISASKIARLRSFGRLKNAGPQDDTFFLVGGF